VEPQAADTARLDRRLEIGVRRGEWIELVRVVDIFDAEARILEPEREGSMARGGAWLVTNSSTAMMTRAMSSPAIAWLAPNSSIRRRIFIIASRSATRLRLALATSPIANSLAENDRVVPVAASLEFAREAR
jgi:hypothetical protein